MTESKKHITKAHDHFFRMVMSEKRLAKEFFETYLPETLRKVTDLNCLELQSGTHINDMRQESIADVLFKTVIEGHEAYLYLVVDHQSRPDKLMPFRVLKYTCNIIDQHLKNGDSKTIPLILPFIVYHGQQKWLFSTDIHDLVDAPKEIVESYFLKPFTLIDLNRIEDAVIREKTWLGIMEFTLKHIFARDMLPYLYDVVKILIAKIRGEPNSEKFIEIVLTYILDRGEISDRKAFFDLIRTEFSEEAGEKIMTIAEQLKAEGLQLGIEQGLQRGLQQGTEQTTTEIALNLLKEGLDEEIIIRVTKLRKEKFNSLKETSII